jgi:hypothetical protein
MMLKASGEFPQAAIIHRCASCDGELHPLCGEMDSNSSRLTCLGYFKQYGRSLKARMTSNIYWEEEIGLSSKCDMMLAMIACWKKQRRRCYLMNVQS